MDRFNTPWRVTSAAIYTTPTDSRVYGTLDIDVTEAKKLIDKAIAREVELKPGEIAETVQLGAGASTGNGGAKRPWGAGSEKKCGE